MKRLAYSAFFIVLLSFGTVTNVVATTVFGIQYEFFMADTKLGTGWMQFDVDPNNLPFDTWIDISSLSMTVNFTNLPTAQPWSAADTISSITQILVHDAHPEYPVTIDAVWPDIFFHAGYNDGESYYNLLLWDDGRMEIYWGLDINEYAQGNWTASVFFDSPPDAPVVPLPPAIWLFGSALVGFGFFGRKRKGIDTNRYSI